MSITNPENVCINCMREKESNGVCPFCGFDEAQYDPSPHHLPPRSILNGKYLIGRVLGEGGFGITYVAWELNLDLKLAIREYFPVSLVKRNSAEATAVTCYREGADERFAKGISIQVDEARHLTKFFSLPGIVSVRDFFHENGTVYVVMEFVEGETLKARVKRCGKLEAQEVFPLVQPMMQSLGAIHGSGMLHKDINPLNIILSAQDNTKLIGFASANCTDARQQSAQIPVCPLDYAAKELYSSRGEAGPFSDVYSLCATIYYAITGIVPQQVLDRLIEDKLESPSSLGVRITPAQEAALLKGLAIQSQDRWQSMQELIEALNSGSDDESCPPMKPAVDAPIKEETGITSVQSSVPELNGAISKTIVPTPQSNEKPKKAQKPPKPPKAERPPKKHLIRPRWLRIVLASVFGLALFVYVFGVLVPSLPSKEDKMPDSFGISNVSKERFLKSISYPDIQGMDQSVIEEKLALNLRKFVFVTLYSGSGQDASAYTTAGFVASASGYIVCHAGPNDDITRVSIRFWGGEQDLDATFIGLDPQTKLAVIHLDGWAEQPSWEREPIWAVTPKDLTPALLSLQSANTKNSDKPILRAEQRRDETYSITSLDKIGLYRIFATTSEGASPPDSGFLFDDGFVVGFEIPASLIDQPETKDGTPVRYWIDTGPINKIAETIAAEDPLYPSFGFTTTKLADQGSTDIHSADGAYVKQVQDGSPAQIAGIRAGDIVTRCNLVKINSRKSFSFFVWRLAVVGEAVSFEIDRDGQIIQLSVTPAPRSTVYPDEFK